MSRCVQPKWRNTALPFGSRLAQVLDLLHGAFDFAATFDFDFAVSHIARDLARVAHDQHIFAGDGLVQLTFDVDEVSFGGTGDHTCSTNEYIFGNQVTFHRARNDGLVWGVDRALEDHTCANENTFVFAAFAHTVVFLKYECFRVYMDIVNFFN